jgi:hypothetical protein
MKVLRADASPAGLPGTEQDFNPDGLFLLNAMGLTMMT